VAIVVLLSGCSKAVIIPQEDIAKEQYRARGDYRIRLQHWNEYHAHKFSVTDSTLVIEELDKGDDRYKVMKHDMPITVPLEDVASVAIYEGTNWWVTGAAIGIVAAGIGFFVWLGYAIAGSAGGVD
jgi:hypothetical protein